VVVGFGDNVTASETGRPYNTYGINLDKNAFPSLCLGSIRRPIAEV
jgi:hypothetical protein